VMSVQRITAAGLARLAPAILPLARAEGLEAHAESIEVRLRSSSPSVNHR
jgi:histidinol dehydrogenase